MSDFAPQESRFSPQRVPHATDLAQADTAHANPAHPPEPPSSQYMTTPADWAQPGQTTQPAAMTAERYAASKVPAGNNAPSAAEGSMNLSQGQPKGTLNVGPRTMTLSENADLENVNPAAPVTKREAGSKIVAPLGAKTTANPGARDGAMAEQRTPAAAARTTGNVCIAHSSIGHLDHKLR